VSTSDAERVLSRIDRSGGPDACWPWVGSRNGGYGRTHVGSRSDGTRKQARAHRISYEIANGPIPDGLNVLHKCDNPPCCNPSHLFLGTQMDNYRDMESKGRRGVALGDSNGARTRPETRARGDNNGSRTRPESRPKGTNHYAATITESEVLSIRAMAGTMSQRLIGLKFGIAQNTVSQIISRKKWKHIP
jgi:hypothetical protein